MSITILLYRSIVYTSIMKIGRYEAKHNDLKQVKTMREILRNGRIVYLYSEEEHDKATRALEVISELLERKSRFGDLL